MIQALLFIAFFAAEFSRPERRVAYRVGLTFLGATVICGWIGMYTGPDHSALLFILGFPTALLVQKDSMPGFWSILGRLVLMAFCCYTIILAFGLLMTLGRGAGGMGGGSYSHAGRISPNTH